MAQRPELSLICRSLEIAGAGRLTLCYVCDPEGNIIELQTWHRENSGSL